MPEPTSSRMLSRPTKVPRPVNGDTSKRERRRAYGRVRPGNLPSIVGRGRLLVDPVVLVQELVRLARRLVEGLLRGEPARQRLLDGGVRDVADLDEVAEQHAARVRRVGPLLDLLEGRLVVRVLHEPLLLPQQGHGGLC